MKLAIKICGLRRPEDVEAAVAASHHPALSIVGTLATENLGIERLVHNTIANPNRTRANPRIARMLTARVAKASDAASGLRASLPHRIDLACP